MYCGERERKRTGKMRLVWHHWDPAAAAAAAAKSLQSCLTLCDPRDGSPPGFPVPGILQARTLQWVAISFSNACNWKVKVKSLSRVQLLATPWTAAYQAPPSMEFARQEYWSGVPLPSPTEILEATEKKDPCPVTWLDSSPPVLSCPHTCPGRRLSGWSRIDSLLGNETKAEEQKGEKCGLATAEGPVFHKQV